MNDNYIKLVSQTFVYSIQPQQQQNKKANTKILAKAGNRTRYLSHRSLMSSRQPRQLNVSIAAKLFYCFNSRNRSRRWLLPNKSDTVNLGGIYNYVTHTCVVYHVINKTWLDCALNGCNWYDFSKTINRKWRSCCFILLFTNTYKMLTLHYKTHKCNIPILSNMHSVNSTF